MSGIAGKMNVRELPGWRFQVYTETQRAQKYKFSKLKNKTKVHSFFNKIYSPGTLNNCKRMGLMYGDWLEFNRFNSIQFNTLLKPKRH